MSATQAASRTSGRQFQEIVDAPDTFVETNPKTRKSVQRRGADLAKQTHGPKRQNEPNRQKRNIAES
jgi:hypothetical protein